MLRNFTWKAFENTGNIDAYLLYKEIERFKANDDEGEQSQTPQINGQGLE